jgi:hypothetical protein
MVSVLEARFPHVIKRLELCWGNPDAFEEMFSDLILDKRGDRTGWPLDAWAELNFLQSIHRLAYGVAGHRSLNQNNPFDPNWTR